jgi:hypothetical protein
MERERETTMNVADRAILGGVSSRTI